MDTCFCQAPGCENEVDCGEEVCSEHLRWNVEFDEIDPDRFWDGRDE